MTPMESLELVNVSVYRSVIHKSWCMVTWTIVYVAETTEKADVVQNCLKFAKDCVDTAERYWENVLWADETQHFT